MALYKYSNDLSSRLPLSNNLYARLQADILTNKIAAGEKLTEQRLCKEYDRWSKESEKTAEAISAYL